MAVGGGTNGPRAGWGTLEQSPGEAPARWSLAWRAGSPGALVVPLATSGRLAVFCRPTRAAVVLGSSQPALDLPSSAAAPDLVRRRSGGAAVLVEPGSQCWLDVFVPAGDPLSEEDVGRAAWWLGELWAEALHSVLGERAIVAVHRGPALTSDWSRLACFSGLGAGEVTLAGCKVVGICQRRDARGAWLFSMAPLVAAPERLAALLVAEEADRPALSQELRRSSAAVPVELDALEAALSRALEAR